MKKFLFISSVLLTFTLTTYSQITKGNWLVGGNGRFALTDSKIETFIQAKSTEFTVSGTIGYFPADKFAIGLKPGYTYGKVLIAGRTNRSTIILLGPFVRYYFLQPEKTVNLFSEISYQFADYNTGAKINNFSIAAGPVVYFNSSVGIEFTTGFMVSKAKGTSGKETEFFSAIGFIIHLEKDK